MALGPERVRVVNEVARPGQSRHEELRPRQERVEAGTARRERRARLEGGPHGEGGV
jgi:hypothetical protein